MNSGKKVSVSMVTYDHEKFIATAIDSVLMQEVDFDYEIVIGEDCSSDKTRDILNDFQKSYPDKIRLLLHKSNIGSYQNFTQTLRASQGEYIALLDGDDYWTSPNKLQKQADFLDSHPEFSMCFHNAKVIFEDENDKPRNYCPTNLKQTLYLEDILSGSIILPLTVIFRSSLVDVIAELPEELRTLQMKDWVRFVLLAQYGKLGYINEIMGVYRIHKGGIWNKGEAWSNNDKRIRSRTAFIEFYEAMNKYFNYKYEEIIKREISWSNYALARAYCGQRNWVKMRGHLLKGFLRESYNDNISKSYMVSLFKDSLKLFYDKLKRGRLD